MCYFSKLEHIAPYTMQRTKTKSKQTSARTHTLAHTYACAHMCTHTHTHNRLAWRGEIYVLVKTNFCSHAHTHTHTHIHAHTPAHTHTYSQQASLKRWDLCFESTVALLYSSAHCSDSHHKLPATKTNDPVPDAGHTEELSCTFFWREQTCQPWRGRCQTASPPEPPSSPPPGPTPAEKAVIPF